MTLPNWIDLPPVWLVLFGALAWFMAEVWAPLGSLLLWPGLAIMAASLALADWAIHAMRRQATTPNPHGEPTALVTGGPFRFSRNPIYLADMGLLAGWCLALGTLAGLVLLAPLYVVLGSRFIRPEEARLAAAFGEPYRAYAARVRRWL